MTLTYAELFAGAGGLSLGLEMAGWRCAAHAEIDPHARAVLRHHWPDVPLHGDVSQLNGATLHGITLLSGGSPCQDLSIAGKRAGMTEGSGTRSSLYFEQVRIWQESEAPYFLWENVLGALSSNAGRDFAAVLSALVGAPLAVPDDGWRGAGVASGPAGVAAWRVLDAQFLGVPQRRRRVFVLCARAGGVDPAEVLALSEGVSGHPAPRREAWEGTAAETGGGAPVAFNWQSGGDCRLNPSESGTDALQRGQVPAVFTKLQYGRYEESTLAVSTIGARDHASQNTDIVVSSPLCARSQQDSSDCSRELTLPVAGGIPRRFMPIECERLMGWPDAHTSYGIDERGSTYGLSDTPRYQMIGNGVASPVAAWIGWRLRDAVAAQARY